MATSVKKGTRFFIDASSAANLKQALAEYPPSLFLQASAALGDALQPFKDLMVKRSSNPPGPIAAGEGVHKQTGRLAGSWGVAVSGTSIADLKGAAFSFAAKKAPLLELGGDVQAPRGTGPTSGWIFIPTDQNKRASGETIQSPELVRQSGGTFVNRHSKRWANFPAAMIDGQTSPAWNLLVTGASGANAFINVGDPMFIMAKKATYRPQLGFYEAGGEFARNVLPSKLADATVKAWKELKE